MKSKLLRAVLKSFFYFYACAPMFVIKLHEKRSDGVIKLFIFSYAVTEL